MLNLKQKVVGAVFGIGLALGVATTSDAMMIIDQIPYRTLYVVKKGDNLTEIATKYKSTIQKIAERNNIENPDLIYPGDYLCIERTATITPYSDKEFIRKLSFEVRHPICS